LNKLAEFDEYIYNFKVIDQHTFNNTMLKSFK